MTSHPPKLGEMRTIYDNQMSATTVCITKLQLRHGVRASFAPQNP
jgi:hypothetical protein